MLVVILEIENVFPMQIYFTAVELATTDKIIDRHRSNIPLRVFFVRAETRGISLLTGAVYLLDRLVRSAPNPPQKLFEPLQKASQAFLKAHK